MQYTQAAPVDETHLLAVRGLIHQEVSTGPFQPKYVNEESSTERRT